MIEAHAWNEKLDLGHEAMDHEHHLQIALVSALADAIEQGRPWMARKLANQLLAYSTVHFGSEEMLMEASAFPGVGVHAGEHRALLDAMREVADALGRDEDALALAFAVELRAGLAGHMAGSDQRLAAYVGPPPLPQRTAMPLR
jgi:hemerythrin